MGNRRVKFRDCRHSGHSAFSLPHPTMQLQQNRCPHSVEQLSVRSSKHSVQFLAALNASGIDLTSSIVLSSSSAGIAGLPSGFSGPRKDNTGRLSRNVPRDRISRPSFSFPLGLPISFIVVFWLRILVTRRYISRIPSRIPSNEYEGGRVCGFSGIEDKCRILRSLFTIL